MPREIVEIIEEAASKLDPAPTVLNDYPSLQNIKVDKNDVFPIIYIDEPISSTGEVTVADAIREIFNLRILFLARDAASVGTGQRKARFDSTQQQHDLVIKEMRALSKQIIANIYKKTFDNTREVKSIAGLVWTNVRNEFNANVSGVALNIDIELNNVDGLCEST